MSTATASRRLSQPIEAESFLHPSSQEAVNDQLYLYGSAEEFLRDTRG